MSIQQAQERAASAIVSNARLQAKLVTQEAEKQAQAIIRQAHTHANRIENSAREYAATLTPDRAKADPSLYQQLMQERYGRR